LKQCRIINYLEPRLRYHRGEALSKYAWRKKVLARDRNRCRNCSGSINDDYRKKRFPLEAHHIIPRRHGGRNTLRNGVTLCRFCHNYFDLMYRMTGRDYHEIRKKETKKKILDEIRELMRYRYFHYLLRRIHDA
jgi:5-methylcytosine-specific restriction endonuclease McrA